MIIHKCDICGREIKPENTFLFKMVKGHKTESFEHELLICKPKHFGTVDDREVIEICAYCKNDIQKVIESSMNDAENRKK